MAGEVLMSISKDEREQAIFRSRRIYQADQESNRVTAARNLAMAEKKSRAEERIVIARNAIQMNLATDDIIKLTGLTREEVENLNNTK
ncbi:MAG: hypothetical protein FWH28_02370 [Clostridiales bacterium]|nr:hypothetical protein [Clostridiales bacterium]